MDTEKEKRLKAAGWNVGSTEDFLGLSDVEAERVGALLRQADKTKLRSKLLGFKLLFLSTIFGIACIQAFAQEKPQPILVDEFGSIGCDQQRGRLDTFFTSLINKPDATGYVVVHGDKQNPMWRLRWQSAILGHRDYRRFPHERIKILSGPDLDVGKVTLWTIPPGAERPNFPYAAYVVERGLRGPVKLAPVGVEVYCPGDTNAEEGFFSILEANPGLRGKVVIRAASQTEFAQSRKELLSKFGRVSSGRLKFFFRKGMGDTELWLLPSRK